MVDLRRAAAIVGVHEHVTRYAPDKSELQIQGESVIKALEDAGLSKGDVDGLLTASMSVAQQRPQPGRLLEHVPSVCGQHHSGRWIFRVSPLPCPKCHSRWEDQLRCHHLQHPCQVWGSFSGDRWPSADLATPG